MPITFGVALSAVTRLRLLSNWGSMRRNVTWYTEKVDAAPEDYDIVHPIKVRDFHNRVALAHIAGLPIDEP